MKGWHDPRIDERTEKARSRNRFIQKFPAMPSLRTAVAPLLLACILPFGLLSATEQSEEAVTKLCGQWRELPNLDAQYGEVREMPPGLQGDWIAIAESLDGGENCVMTGNQERILRTSGDGWSSGDAPDGTPETPFLKIYRNDQDPKTPAWFIATGKNMPLYMLHTPKGERHFLVRKLAIDGATNDVREVRRYVARVAPVRLLAAQAKAGGVGPGRLPLLYLMPWVPGDLDAMTRGTQENKWPKYVPENSLGILVTDLLPAAVGIQPNDVIYSIDGKLVTSKEKLDAVLGALTPGKPFDVKLKRVQPNSKGVPTWMVVEGGRGEAVTDAAIVEHKELLIAKAKAQQEAKQRKEAEDRRKQEEAMARVYKLRNGRQLTGAEIDEFNKSVLQENLAAGEGPSKSPGWVRAVGQVIPGIRILVADGNADALRDYMATRFSSENDLVKQEVERVLTASPARNFILPLEDGTALFSFEVWEEAAASLLP